MLQIEAKDIYLKYIQLEDAKFLHSLRTDPALSRYLSVVDPKIATQIKWLEKYKERERNKKEYYFIIHLKTGEKMGAIRMYDFIADSFCWGSWIIKQNAPIYTAIESILAVFEYGFDYLGFTRSHFDAMKDNSKVVDFYINFGAKISREENGKYYFVLGQEDFEKTKIKYKRFYQKIITSINKEIK